MSSVQKGVSVMRHSLHKIRSSIDFLLQHPDMSVESAKLSPNFESAIADASQLLKPENYDILTETTSRLMRDNPTEQWIPGTISHYLVSMIPTPRKMSLSGRKLKKNYEPVKQIWSINKSSGKLEKEVDSSREEAEIYNCIRDFTVSDIKLLKKHGVRTVTAYLEDGKIKFDSVPVESITGKVCPPKKSPRLGIILSFALVIVLILVIIVAFFCYKKFSKVKANNPSNTTRKETKKK